MEDQNQTNENVSLNKQPNQNQPQGLGHWLKTSIVAKGILIFLITLLLLIPSGSIKSLIYERERRQNDATNEVINKWAGEQVLIGPFISIPAKKVVLDQYGNDVIQVRYLHILPEELEIGNTVNVNDLNRGLFNISVYENDCKINGYFKIPDVKSLVEPNEELSIIEATLNLGLSDLRGIENKMIAKFGDSTYNFLPGPSNQEVIYKGLHTPINLSNEKKIAFEIPLKLKGSSSLDFIPMGRKTEVSITSEWKDPSFYGNFLPDHREVNNDGFIASWTVIDLNRDFGQYWLGTKIIRGSQFGVQFIQPVDHYAKSMRSIKYSVLIICLTFIVFFFIELLQKIKIHPVQYVLVGFALIIFFLLLISVSEHIAFNKAYLISSLAVVGLIAAYLKPVLKSWKRVLLSSGLVAAGYGFIFITLQDQDYALLIGSIGLFITLAAIMLLSRKVNWYNN